MSDVTPATAVVVPPSQQLFLAFDVGLKRTGVASGNRITASATPLTTLRQRGKAMLEEAQRCVQEWQPDALVIGVPRHPDGAPHEMTLHCQKVARQLRERTRLTVYEVDERYSTTEALSQGAKDPDAAAACIILEQFLRSLP